MSPSASIIRYLANGQATADALSDALNLTPGCIDHETTQLITASAIQTGSITIGGLSIITYLLTPAKLQQLSDKPTN